MSFNLRGAVLANVSGNSQDQLQETIVDAIQSGEEKMLPVLAFYSKSFGKMLMKMKTRNVRNIRARIKK